MLSRHILLWYMQFDILLQPYCWVVLSLWSHWCYCNIILLFADSWTNEILPETSELENVFLPESRHSSWLCCHGDYRYIWRRDRTITDSKLIIMNNGANKRSMEEFHKLGTKKCIYWRRHTKTYGTFVKDLWMFDDRSCSGYHSVQVSAPSDSEKKEHITQYRDFGMPLFIVWTLYADGAALFSAANETYRLDFETCVYNLFWCMFRRG